MDSNMERSRPIAAFMAFGTKGDIYPIAALASAFASNQHNYNVLFITHSAHQDLATHLTEQNVSYMPISSPPTLSPPEGNEKDDSLDYLNQSFHTRKNIVKWEHRRECVSVIERIFGDAPTMKSDFILINFFALEGWSLAELFHVRCVVAAPYVMHYTAPSSFERQFRLQLPDLYKFLQNAPFDKLGWKDVMHWMWPLFSDDWGSWRKDALNLSPLPFTDPVTSLPMWHERPSAPLLLYGFSKEIVECPQYWPLNTRVCGFWFLPPAWQFSCDRCQRTLYSEQNLCSVHTALHTFLNSNLSTPLVFVGLSSGGNLGFLRNPVSFLHVLRSAIDITICRIILFTAGFVQLNAAIVSASKKDLLAIGDGVTLFDGSLFCFSGSLPYSWLFPKCSVVIHHGGSGSTAAALKAGIPQIICPLMADQFYWAERMCWLGVAPEPLKIHHLVPENCDDASINEGALMLSHAIKFTLHAEIKENCLKFSKKISMEDGVLQAVRILKEEMS